MSKSISLLYISTHDLVLKTLLEYMPNSTKKNALTLAQARPCDGVATSSPCQLLQPILQFDIWSKRHQNPRLSMTQSKLCCHTGITWSSALLRAPSSLFIVRSRAWPRTSSSTNFYFYHFFCRLFQTKISKLLTFPNKAYFKPHGFVSSWEIPFFLVSITELLCAVIAALWSCDIMFWVHSS